MKTVIAFLFIVTMTLPAIPHFLVSGEPESVYWNEGTSLLKGQSSQDYLNQSYNPWNFINYTPSLVPSDNPKNITVAVLDSGLNKTALPAWTNKDEVENNGVDDDNNGFVDDYYGWDFVKDQPVTLDNIDYADHGSFVGHIVSNMTPQALVMDVRVLDSELRNGDFRDFARALEYVLQFPEVKVVQLSTEFNPKEWNPLPAEVQWSFTKAYLQGVTIVSVAGNGGLSTISEPGRWAETITVTSVDPTTGVVEHATRANTGTNIDVSAPGADISSFSQSGALLTLSGTSFASAFVGGAVTAALVLRPTLTPAEVRTLLHHTTDPLGSCDVYGAGMVNVGQFLRSVLTDQVSELPPHSSGCTPDYEVPSELPPRPSEREVPYSSVGLLVALLVIRRNRPKKPKS